MGGWWRKIVAPKGGSDTHKMTASAECESEFRLESLEPRLLLSADPITAELARVVQDNAQSNDANAVAAIIQEVDQAAETQAAEQSDSNHGNLQVVWPAGWNAASDEVESTDTQRSVTGAELRHIDLQAVVVDLVARAIKFHNAAADASQTDLVVDITADSYSPQETDHTAVDSASGVETDHGVGPELPDQGTEQSVQPFSATPANTPQADLKVDVSADNTHQESDQSAVEGPSVDGPSGVESGQAVDQQLLDQVLKEVVQSFSDTQQADWLGHLDIQVADLSGDLVAELRGDTLLIDSNAAGKGWFIDPVLLAKLTQTADVQAIAESDPVVAVHQTNAELPLTNSLLDAESHTPVTGDEDASHVATENEYIFFTNRLRYFNIRSIHRTDCECTV